LTALLRVSVVAGSRRVDLAVSPALPVAELVPGLARRLGVVSYDGLHLATAAGDPLDDAAGLAGQRVPDGAVLCLAPSAPPPVVHDDPAQALVEMGSTVDAEAPPPGATRSPAWGGWPACAASGLLLALGAVAAATACAPREAGVVALLLLAAGLTLGRAAPGPGVVLVTGACGYAAVASALLAAGARPGQGPVWSAAGGAGIAVASVAMAALPRHRLRLLPVLVVAAVAAVVGAVVTARPVPVPVLACVVLAVAVLATTGLPWVAVGRISSIRARVDAVRLADDARVARELLAGLGWGLAIVQLVVTPVVAGHGTGGLALAGCASAFAAVRSSRAVGVAEALPGLVAGGLGLLATAAVALASNPAWRPTGSAALAVGAGVLLAGRWLGLEGVLARSARHALEAVCLVALLPLVVLATGTLGRLA
jgi:hypothetical protein